MRKGTNAKPGGGVRSITKDAHLLLRDLGLLLGLGLGGEAVVAGVALGVGQGARGDTLLEGGIDGALASIADLVLGLNELDDGL